MSELTLTERVTLFSREPNPKTCTCKHQMAGPGGVFYQSVGLIHCTRCKGWQLIRKQVL